MFKKNVYRLIIEALGWFTASVIILGLIYIIANLIIILLPVIILMAVVGVGVYLLGVFKGKKKR